MKKALIPTNFSKLQEMEKTNDKDFLYDFLIFLKKLKRIILKSKNPDDELKKENIKRIDTLCADIVEWIN